jgi:hypothetical protein
MKFGKFGLLGRNGENWEKQGRKTIFDFQQ